MNGIILHVPEPCYESWTDMAATPSGRFCDRCQHAVADLTNATDAELVTLFSGPGAPKCARFDPAQLHRALHPGQHRRGTLPIAAFTSLLALAMGSETIAQTGTPPLLGDVGIPPAQVDTVIGDTLRLPPATLAVPLEQPPPTTPTRTPPKRHWVGKPLIVPKQDTGEPAPER